MFGKIDSATGQEIYPKLELVRLAIPRRVYTNMHMQYVSEVLKEIAQIKNKLKGMKIVYQTEILRHFTAKLDYI